VAIDVRLVGAPELAAALGAVPASLRAANVRAMNASLVLVEADARRNVVHDTRQLMNSITHRVTERGEVVTGTVGPTVAYGLYVEQGTRPHWPPRAPLVAWARRHGIPVFLVQRAIARRGTRARPFLVPALTKNHDKIVARFAAASAQVTAAVARSTGPGAGSAAR